MNPEEIEAGVKDVVSKCLHVPAEKLHAGTTWDDLKADSLSRIEVTLILEDTFKLIVPDEEAAKFKTLADVVAFIHGRLTAKAPSPAPAP
jgi:acyl carrier protein